MNQMILLAVATIVLCLLWRGGAKEGFFSPYYQKWDVLSKDVFSLDRRVDAVPDDAFIKHFEDSRHVSCVRPDDWRLWQYCDEYHYKDCGRNCSK